MSRYIKYILVLLLALNITAFAQEENTAKLDSLKTELKKASHDTTRAKLYLNLAENCYDPAEWPAYNQKSINLSEQLIKSADSSIRKFATQTLANGLNNKGYFFSSVGRFDSAMYFYLRATELMIKTKDKEGSGIVMMNIGRLLNDKGDYVGSIEYYYKSLKVFESIKNDIGLSQIYNNLASVFNYLKDEEKAKEYFFKSLEIKKRLNNPILLSYGLSNLGAYYDKHKMYDSARIYYHKALIIKRKFRDIQGIMNIYNNLGASYMDEHKYDSAQIYLKKSLQLSEQYEFAEGMAYTYNNFSEMELKKNNTAEALAYAEKALAIAEKRKLFKVLLTSYRNLTFVHKKNKNFEKAMYYSNCYHRMNDSLLNSDKQRSIAVLQIKHDYEKEMFADSIQRANNELKKEIGHQAEIQKQKTLSYIGIIAAVFMFLLVMLLFNRYKIKQRNNELLEEKNHIIVKQKEKVELQKELLQRKNNEVTDSINYANRIQKALLVSDKTFEKKVKEHFILFRPKDIVSGDFYWITEVPEGVIVVTGDCTGHGVPGAFMSILMINKLSEAVKEKKITRPDLILNHVRSEVIKALNPEDAKEVTRDGMDAIVCRFDFKNRKLEFSAANNSFCLIKNGMLMPIKADMMPVGKSDNETTPFSYNEMLLDEGDIVYTYTDGYADQFGGPNGKKFKKARLKQLLQNISTLPMNTQKTALEKELENWKGDLEQIDDICIIGIRI